MILYGCCNNNEWKKKKKHITSFISFGFVEVMCDRNVCVKMPISMAQEIN